MAQKRIVHLRVYRGERLSFDANGKVQNENHLVKTHEDSQEYKNLLTSLKISGYCKVEVDNVLKLEGGSYNEVDAPDIAKEVKEAFEAPRQEKELTPDQKRIAELERKLEAVLTGKKEKPKKKKVETPEIYVPELPKGKTLDDLKRTELEDMFPNIQELNPANKTDFIAQVNEMYPNQYK